ncbi:MAG: hypothetical protein WB524_04885 [Acidobacteriaceae bacterium]
MIVQIRFGTKDDWNPQQPGGNNRIERRETAVAENPDRIEASLAETMEYAPVERFGEAKFVTLPEAGQKLILIAVEKRHVPLNVNSKPTVFVPADRMIAAEEYRQVDIRFPGDTSQQGSLVLNRMAHEIGKANGFGCPGCSRPSFGSTAG